MPIRVTNDILKTADTDECSVLVLLDLSATFDATVHKTFLTERLQHQVGISGTALQFYFCFVFLLVTTALPILKSGVPQGSILGPILFFKKYIYTCCLLATLYREIIFCSPTMLTA